MVILMAFAIEQNTQLSNQLRFLLFEIGIGFTPRAMDSFLIQAHAIVFNHFTQLARQEHLPLQQVFPLGISETIAEFKKSCYQQNPASRFYQWDKIEKYLYKQLIQTCLQAAWNHHTQAWIEKQFHQTPATNQQIFCELSQWACMINPDFRLSANNVYASERELLQYSASFRAKIHLHWLAINIHAENPSSIKLLQELQLLLQQYFPQQYQYWQQKISYMMLNPKQYLALPMHPLFWRKIKNTNAIMQNAIPIPMPQPMHVLNHLGHVSTLDDQSPWFRFHYQPLSTSKAVSLLSHKECIDINKKLQGICIRNRLQILPVLKTINSESSFILSLQENPHTLISGSSCLLPITALLSHLESHHMLNMFLQKINVDPMDFFKKFLQAALSSLNLLISDNIALTLDPQSCLISWDSNKKTCNIFIVNSEVRTFVTSEDEENKQQICAHWQYNLLQMTIQMLISEITILYGYKAATLWEYVCTEIETIFTCFTKTSQTIFYKKQIFQTRWPAPAFIGSMLNPQQAEYQLNYADNLCFSPQPKMP